MKILLVNTNQAMQPYPVLPIGLCSVAAALKKEGHEVRFLDLCFANETEPMIAAMLLRFKAEIIGLGVRNLDNSDLIGFRWFLPSVCEIAGQIRRYSRAPIVAGGAAVSVMPKAVLEYLHCELGVIGDGEQPFLDLVAAMRDRKDFSQIPGIAGFDQGRWFLNPKNPVMNYEIYGAVHLHEWVDVHAYMKRGSIYPVQSNRGCAFSCIYCTYTQIEGKKYRLRPEQIVVEEVRHAREKAGIDYFEFVDSVFNVPESHAKNVCREIIKARLGVKFGAAGINPKWLSSELLDLMEEAGFNSLDITIESASAAMLKNLKKGFEITDILEAARKLKNRKIKILWVLLLGGPGETSQTLEESFRFVDDFVRPEDIVYITAGLRIYPDTALSQKALAEGAIQDQEELIRPSFYLSADLPFDSMREKIFRFCETRPNVMASFDSSHRLIPLAYRILHWAGAKKPYWRYSSFFNRASRFFSQFRKASGYQKPPRGIRSDSYYIHSEAPEIYAPVL